VIARRTLLVCALLAACATSPPPGPSHGPASAVTAEDENLLDAMKEAIGVQGRSLYAAQATAAPDCARVCHLVGNICALAEKICGIAARYPASDPVAAECLDARAGCRQAHESASACACRQTF
jgi:hypothetical protein